MPMSLKTKKDSATSQRILHLPKEKLFADAESNICKYNSVIVNDITLF